MWSSVKRRVSSEGTCLSTCRATATWSQTQNLRRGATSSTSTRLSPGLRTNLYLREQQRRREANGITDWSCYLPLLAVRVITQTLLTCLWHYTPIAPEVTSWHWLSCSVSRGHFKHRLNMSTHLNSFNLPPYFSLVCPTHGLRPPDEAASSVGTDRVWVVSQQRTVWQQLITNWTVDQHHVHHFLFVQDGLEDPHDGLSAGAKLER